MLFGDSWVDAGRVAAVLAPFLWISVVVSPISRLILVSGRVELKLVADVVRLVLPVGALFLARDWGFVPAMVAFSAASCCAYLLYLWLIWYAISRPGPSDDRSSQST